MLITIWLTRVKSVKLERTSIDAAEYFTVL